MPIKTYAQAINEATEQLLESDSSVVLIGEGVPDGIFGSTTGLKEKYPQRVFDSPISEAGVTGALIGASLSGLRPIQVHQRCDFLTLSVDQLVNNASKIWSMFGKPCPIVLRAIVGRAWGNGPTHTQNFAAMFASIPGLKVVVPTSAHDVKGLLIAAVRDPNPVIFIEHRWLYNIEDNVPSEIYEVPLDKSKLLRTGEDITVVSMSYSTIEALKAHELLKSFHIQSEVIDLISCSPIDIETIGASVRKTGRLIVVDTGHTIGSIGSEIIRQVAERYFHCLRTAPIVIGLPDYPCPTSHFLTENYYYDDVDIANACLNLVGSLGIIPKQSKKDHDIFPGFQGPF